MTLSSVDMERLWNESSRFFGHNHKTWLGEAFNAVRATGDLSGAVELLRQVRRDAAREAERNAVDDVVGWLDRRKRAQPTPTKPRLLLELGWLRRMSVVRAASHQGDERGRSGGRGGSSAAGNGRRRSRYGGR